LAVVIDTSGVDMKQALSLQAGSAESRHRIRPAALE
jgi:hypothetical protein